MRLTKIFQLCLCLTTNVFSENIFISRYVFEWGDTNPEIVEKYLRSSLDNPVSAYVLGNLYLTGTFLQKNLQKADWYITKAANMNLPEAVNSIGDGYYSGDIRPKNINMALKCYRKSADMGFGVAQFNAGVVLLSTAKSKKELELAIAYLDKASRNREDLGEIAHTAERYKRNAEKKLKIYRAVSQN